MDVEGVFFFVRRSGFGGFVFFVFDFFVGRRLGW